MKFQTGMLAMVSDQQDMSMETKLNSCTTEVNTKKYVFSVTIPHTYIGRDS